MRCYFLLIVTLAGALLVFAPPGHAQEKRFSGIITKPKGPPHQQGYYGQERDFRSMWKELHPYDDLLRKWKGFPFSNRPGARHNPSDPDAADTAGDATPDSVGGIGKVGGPAPDFVPPATVSDIPNTSDNAQAPEPAHSGGIGNVGGSIGSVGGISDDVTATQR